MANGQVCTSEKPSPTSRCSEGSVHAGCFPGWDGAKQPQAKGLSHSYRWPPVGKIQQGALRKGYGKQCPQEKQIFFSCRGLAWFYSLGWQILSQPGWSPQSFPGANVNFKWKSAAESITIVCFQTLSPLEVLLGAHRDWSSMHRA